MSNPFAPVPRPAVHSLFFAVRPPHAVGQRILEETARLPLGGTPVRLDRLHVTTLSLVHYGEIPHGLADEAAYVAAAMRNAPFRVIFDRLIAGEKSALLLPSEPLDALRMFRERLGFTLMRGLGFRFDARFNPHVTVAYANKRRFETPIDPIIWTVDEFVLIDSQIGQARQVEVGRWRLGA